MNFDIRHGDALDRLREMPDCSVNCCITSPPYFGLRQYLPTGHPDAAIEIGLESTPEQYITRLVEVFREVRRVLREDGTCWVNIGDSYNAQPGQRKTTDKAGDKQATSIGSVGAPSRCVAGIKPKDLIGIPWMLAFALRADGWYLRSEIIWHKPNPMPESVRDRPTKAHEQVFLFSKSERYFYDAAAVAEKSAGVSGGPFSLATAKAQINHGAMKLERPVDTGTRNRRSVWTISSLPTPEAHFATFPIDLPELCLKAGCPIDGTVLDPFSGAGTTGLACLKNGRNYIGIELNAAYIEIAHQRARKYYPLLIEATA